MPTAEPQTIRYPSRLYRSGICWNRKNPRIAEKMCIRDRRWSGLLGKLLGDGYHVVEEGMDGRTTAFEDDLQPWRSALGYIGPCVKTCLLYTSRCV